MTLTLTLVLAVRITLQNMPEDFAAYQELHTAIKSKIDRKKNDPFCSGPFFC